MSEPTIEDIILQKDQRGIAALRPFLPQDFCTQAAQYVLDRPGTTLITTGFYILYGDAVETDGPPGALAIGKALEALGRDVIYVTDKYCGGVMQTLAGPEAAVVEFPIADPSESREFAQGMLDRLDPALLISIERCSPSQDGVYRNMRSVDITGYTARVDALFDLHEHSVGIGDGGNEIGMGLLRETIPTLPRLPQEPAWTACKELIITSVSNWGGWGLTAALSKLTGKNLLPTLEEESERIRKCVEMGVVDGFTGELKASVDGFPLEEYNQTLTQLHDLLSREGVPTP
jgi:hypothetical protein